LHGIWLCWVEMDWVMIFQVSRKERTFKHNP